MTAWDKIKGQRFNKEIFWKGKDNNMGTRAVYTFHDNTGTFHVYMHHNGHPKGAIGFIKAAFDRGWVRANDLAVSFIVNNGWSDNDCELTKHYDKHDDLRYRYEITKNTEKGEVFFDVQTGIFDISKLFVISAFIRSSEFSDAPTYDLIFSGPLDEFEEHEKLIL